MAESDARYEESPDPKKPRLEKSLENDVIFNEFYSDPDLLTDLKIGIQAIQEWNDYSVCMLKIANCNGTGSYPFSRAFCETECFKCEHRLLNNSKIVKKFSFASIFKYGEKVLTSYVKPKNESFLPQRKGARIAFAKLLHFLSYELEGAEKSLMSKKGVQESEWTVVLSHHLLSKLAVSALYKIDSGYKGRQYKCPCQCGEDFSGMYGDTSIGSPPVWHGHLDVMMDISVKFAEEEADSPGGYGNHSSDEVKLMDLKTSREQIIAQSIVFSFYQKRVNPDYANHLIPSIGISKEKIVVYFYDCINDVLLESPEMPYISADGAFVKPTIVALWLVLNFKYFCSGITKGIKELGFTSGFVQIVQEKLKYYNEVTAPCESRDDIKEDPWTWGVPPEKDEPAEELEDFNKLRPWEKP
nr:uncharacterized protein LOC111113434 isoform X2 [Crassostrea virginica]XP_022307431.1 uncharacterized protein LOC111113434 isoform X2 [Crassostrea virginica]